MTHMSTKLPKRYQTPDTRTRNSNIHLHKLFHSVLRGPPSGTKHLLCTTTNLRFQRLTEFQGMITPTRVSINQTNTPDQFMLTRKCNVLSIMQECRPDLSSKSECLETSNRKRKYEKLRRRQIYRTQEMSEKRGTKSNGYLGRISTDGNDYIHPCQPEPDTCRCGGVNVVIRYTLLLLFLNLNFKLY